MGGRKGEISSAPFLLFFLGGKRDRKGKERNEMKEKKKRKKKKKMQSMHRSERLRGEKDIAEDRHGPKRGDHGLRCKGERDEIKHVAQQENNEPNLDLNLD